MEKVKAEKIENDSITKNQAKNETLTTELHFELLKQYAWLSSAIIGSLIIFIQLKTIEIGQDVFISLGLLCLSIIVSLMGQDYLVDSLLKGRNIYKISKIMKIIRWSSTGAMGLGVGYFIGHIF